MAMTTKDKQRDAEFGHRLRKRREQTGLTIAELAARVGMAYTQIADYEAGDASLRASGLELIAFALEVPVSYFYSNDEQCMPLASIAPEILTCAEKLAAIRDDSTRGDLLILINHAAGLRLS